MGRLASHVASSSNLLRLCLQFPVGFNSRDDEVSELALGMADVSTNLVMLTGAPGVGRSMLAASLAHDLVVTHHWADAYWIDLQGVNNVVLAGM